MAVGRFPSVLEILQSNLQATTNALIKNLEDDKTVATRKLRQSILLESGVDIFGERYVLHIDMEDYWKFVEEGRTSGKRPPIEPIIKWIRAKGLVSASQLSQRRRGVIKSLKSRRVKKGFKQRSIEQLTRQRAWAIAVNIGKKGTIQRFGYRGTHFFSRVVNQQWINGLAADLGKALNKDIQLEIKGTFNLLSE